MLFNYTTVDEKGQESQGSIDAVNVDIAIASLQRRGLIIASIKEANAKGSFLSMNISLFDRVSTKDVVILSRQLSTLFEAQVSALRIFRMLAGETENKVLGSKLTVIADDLQGGSSISAAMAKHPKVFSNFYVNMIKAGEESGKLDETFLYLADYLDRTYELSSKAKGALIYPAFVIVTFVTVMILMFTIVIPKIIRHHHRLGRRHPGLHPGHPRHQQFPRQLRLFPPCRGRRHRLLPLSLHPHAYRQVRLRPVQASRSLCQHPLSKSSIFPVWPTT